ncbi:unnamed protein product [Mytilus coruscus]|uniref:Uncharacterized protein n=1 Tax=Mytilus coruscus TaxID=42192 RepID=A0A6J8E837_MYTCO|nr:unnamed protein product [Mytilus coruscus]
MDVGENSICFMLSIYNVKFASKLREDVAELSIKHCYGCSVHHPSQVHHTCLMWNELEHLEMHLKKPILHRSQSSAHKVARRNEKLEQSNWTSCYTVDISEHARDTFIKLLDDVEWRKKNLPNQIDYTRTCKTSVLSFKDSLQRNTTYKPLFYTSTLYNMTMFRRIIHNSVFLKTIYLVDPIERKALIRFTEEEHIQALCDIAKNILQGRITISIAYKQKLKQYKTVIRSLASSRIVMTRKRRMLLTFNHLIPLLIKPILHILDES